MLFEVNKKKKLLLHILACSSFIQLLLSYLHSDEWENFRERLGSEKVDDFDDEEDDEKEEELRDWASFRGQTLSRTGEF